MRQTATNPINELYRTHQASVRSTRDDFVEYLTGYAPSFVRPTIALLEARQARSPLLLVGEVIPWLLADLTKVPADAARQIGVGWLSLYAASAALDDVVDHDSESTPVAVLLPSVLISCGLQKLHKFVLGTPYEETFLRELGYAFEYELKDVQHHSLHSVNKQTKAKIALLKNSGIVALTAACAAVSASRGSAAIAFVRNVLGPLQLLDDLLDLKIDLEKRRYTYVAELFSEDLPRQAAIPDFETLITKSLLNGRLRDFSVSIEETLQDALRTAMNELNESNPTENAMFEFVSAVILELQQFSEWVDDFTPRIRTLPEPRRSILINREVRRRVEIFAQSS